MSTHGSKGTTPTEAPRPAGPEFIRNVVLVGPAGAGKTTLFEHLLAHCVPSHRPSPTADQHSTALSAATLQVRDHTVTIIDTPGFPDFVGDVRAGLRAADAAIFVVSATDPIDGSTELLWEECAEVGTPRAVVVTKLDLHKGTFDDAIASAQNTFGDAQALYLPLDKNGTFTGLIDLLNQRSHEGSKREECDDASRDSFADRRASLIEAIIQESEDDTLLDRYLGGEEVSLDTVLVDLRKAVALGTFYPMVPVHASSGVGLDELFDLMIDGFPTPALHPLPAVTTPHGEPVEALVGDPGGPLVAEVIKTSSDPYVGRISLVRVFNGTLRADDTLHVSGHLEQFAGHPMEGHADHDSNERIGPLSAPLGGATLPKKEAIAGEIVIVSKLAKAETSDTLSSVDQPRLIEPWKLPEPLLPVAIHAVAQADEDKLASALQRLVAEDVTMRLDHNSETHQVVLWAMGQAHIDLLLARLADRYGVHVDVEPLRVPLRETFVAPAKSTGKHVKQSGGHGQFAVCHVEIEPLERGAGFEFVDKVVGGSVPRQFIPSVEKGIRNQMAKGTLAGYPMVDIRVTLVDGKAHSVDSSDMAFQMAGALALKEATSHQTVALLEPVDTVLIDINDEHLGAVMGDLNTRRGRVLGTEPGRISGRTTITAEVPALELTRYPIELRSLSQGTGRFTRTLARYDVLPQHLSADLLKLAHA